MVFYCSGEIEIKLRVGEITINAVQRFSSHFTKKKVDLSASKQTTELLLEKICDVNKFGWYSGDNHFHLNSEEQISCPYRHRFRF